MTADYSINVSEFLFEILKSKATQILPKEKQRNNLPHKEDIQTSFRPFCDLIYIIERFLKSRIIPKPIEVIYSSEFSTNSISDTAKSNLNRLISRLTKGLDVNSMDYGFIPPSSKNYLKFSPNDQYRYTVDYSNQFFGIRHFHLNGQDRSEDVLLYYVLVDDKIYFLSTGTHKDMYTKANVVILINQFPQLLNKLGIDFFPDMPIASQPNESIEYVKNSWENGSNVSFVINDKYYTSVNLQTTSRLNSEIIRIYQNMEYQLKQQLDDFELHLKNQYPEEKDEFEIVHLNYENGESVINGCICIGNPRFQMARQVRINYLNRLDELRYFGI